MLANVLANVLANFEDTLANFYNFSKFENV